MTLSIKKYYKNFLQISNHIFIYMLLINLLVVLTLTRINYIASIITFDEG